MAHSLELRVPYLDRRVWETAAKLMPRLKMRGRITKPALRLAALKRIPAAVANREKAGFLVPFRTWLRKEPYYGTVKAVFDEPWAAEFFDTAKLDRMLEEHRAGTKNNSRSLYTVYSFLLWYREFFLKDKNHES